MRKSFFQHMLAGFLLGCAALAPALAETTNYRTLSVAAVQVTQGSGYSMSQLFLDLAQDRKGTEYDGKLYSKGYNKFKQDFMAIAGFKTESELNHDNRKTWWFPAVGSKTNFVKGSPDLKWIVADNAGSIVPDKVTVNGVAYHKGEKTGMYAADAVQPSVMVAETVPTPAVEPVQETVLPNIVAETPAADPTAATQQGFMQDNSTLQFQEDSMFDDSNEVFVEEEDVSNQWMLTLFAVFIVGVLGYLCWQHYKNPILIQDDQASVMHSARYTEAEHIAPAPVGTASDTSAGISPFMNDSRQFDVEFAQILTNEGIDTGERFPEMEVVTAEVEDHVFVFRVKPEDQGHLGYKHRTFSARLDDNGKKEAYVEETQLWIKVSNLRSHLLKHCSKAGQENTNVEIDSVVTAAA